MLPSRGLHSPTTRTAHGLTLVALGLVSLVLLFRDGQYSSQRRFSRVRDSFAVVKNLVLAYFLVAGMVFATKGFFTGFTSLSRMVIVINLFVMGGVMVAARFELRRRQTHLFALGQSVRRVLVVGRGPAARDFLAFLDARPWLGVRVAGMLGAPDHEVSHEQDGEPIALRVLGEVSEAAELLKLVEAEEVIVALDEADSGVLHEVTASLTAANVPFHVVPSLFEQSYRSAKLVGFEELPVIDTSVDPLDRAQQTFKRAFDVVLSTAVLLLGSPVLLAIALAVKLTSPGPVLFEQERVGRNGRPFVILKFRTMYVDAEERLEELRDRNEAEGHLFKMKDDPRVTPVGRMLRRLSLDELPQFVNVLHGEMSVVGPRPPLPSEVDCYESPHYCRLRGKPGITGLWQISGRSTLTFDEMVKLDRFYLENWSLGLDFSIVLKTMHVVLTRKGAY